MISTSEIDVEKRIKANLYVFEHDFALRGGLAVRKGVFRAALNLEYDYLWIRDVMNIGLAFEAVKDYPIIQKIYDAVYARAFFCQEKLKTSDHTTHENDMFPSKYEIKSNKPYTKGWGHHQLDAIGMLMYKTVDLGEKGIITLDSKIEKLMFDMVEYCKRVSCFDVGDNGMWEEWRELHSSSMGAVIAGLEKLRDTDMFPSIKIDQEFIDHGRKQLYALLPRESPVNSDPKYHMDKSTDAALLTLIWPYNLFHDNKEMEDKILSDVETVLVRDKGVLRYVNDRYEASAKKLGKDKYRYYKNGEAQWPLFFSYLSLAYTKRGDKEKARHYLNRSFESMVEVDGVMVFPESFRYHPSPTKGVFIPSGNIGLAWNHALEICALVEYKKKFSNSDQEFQLQN
jgi:GH15 family glucan-1,4-alpha-glucosidase